MDPERMRVPKALASLRQRRAVDTVGPAGVAIGIVLVALGWMLEEESIGMGAAIRTLGGIALLAGLAIVVFGDSRRRATVIRASRRICGGYLAKTSHWKWPDRVGLAAVVIGIVLVVPALVLQIVFRNGAIVAGPAVLLFWVGIILLIYGRFHGRNETGAQGPSPPSRGESRGGRRL